ncbi:restriction endonuclease subunit S [Solwaraspora sp. WMMD792]|uniref:restriction endonuclease subunit S n=1 Tax=Solwaraspora sp. WMMD792 TaxID=3016099 RepID=UPI00241596DE|nr:restriction endonuclease subunit S [Solwaraspora sp. WMMD792]MDG4774973.1 restriction endonuclease subunit S [Solwaraspora sp. WMMD792]
MKTVRLRHVAQVNPPSPAFDRLSPDAELTFLPMESIWPDSRLDTSQRRTKSAVATGYTRFQDGDVLVPKITPTFEACRSILVRNLYNGAGAGTTELHTLRAGPKLDPRFLLHLTRTHPFLKLGKAEMYGVAGQQRVPDEFIRNLEVQLPPKTEQRRIADILDAQADRVNKVTDLLNQIIARLDERNASVLDTELDELAKTAGTRPFRRYIAGFDQGSSPQCEAVPAGNNEWGILKVSCLRPGQFFPDENKRLPEELTPSPRHEVQPGDLLITRANTPELVGATAVVPPNTRAKLLLSDKIFRVRTSSQIDPSYLATVARGRRIRALCSASSNGASQSMANLRFEEVKEWPIPAIDLDLQRDLVSQTGQNWELTQAVRERVRRQIFLLKERQQAFVTLAIAGKIDVTNTAATTGR